MPNAKKEKLQNVECVKCHRKSSVDISDLLRPYNKTNRAYWCWECLKKAGAYG